MMPVKDTLEKLAPASAASAPQVPVVPKQETGGLRSDAVSLEVLVRVHGSLVTDAGSGATPHTEPFEEQTSTMIVFPQGGVLKMTTAVSIGQMLVVTNQKSGQDAICRVVKVRAFAHTQSYVEVEFTHRQVGYWGVQFSSDVDETPKKPAPLSAARVPINPSTAFDTPAPQIHVAPASKVPAPSVRPVEPAKPASSFVGIGSQEEVQISATPTARAKQSSPASSNSSPALGLPPLSVPPGVSNFPAPSVEELRGDAAPPVAASPDLSELADSLSLDADNDEPLLILEDESIAEVSSAPLSSPATRSFGESTNLGGIKNPGGTRPLAREMFGVQLETEKAVAHAGSSPKWALIAAATVLLAVVCAGGYYLINKRATAPAAQVAQSALQQAPAPSVPPVGVAPVAPSPGPTNTAKTPQVRSAVASSAPPAASARTEAPNEAKQSAPPVVSAEAPAAAPVAEQHRSSSNGNMPNLFGSLNAHPVATRSAAQEDEAPAIPTGTSAAAEGLAGIAPASSALPVPPASTTKPPRLISSVPPVYPEFARQRGIEGNVVIQAIIEANGAVGATKVISGPQPLREAAVYALRQWKYEAGKVDGQPASTEVTVTLHFSSK
jgi:periplasmic protein TonB